MAMHYTEITGGVTAPQGFLAGSIYCGIKATNPDRPDIALVYSPQPTVAAGTFTTNRVKAAPVRVSKLNLGGADIRAIVANSGNANACTGPNGIENAKRMTRAVAKTFGLKEKQVLVCSTGRIGVPLPIEKMEQTIGGLPERISAEGSGAAAEAIMTSDTFPKSVAVELELGGRKVRIGGIAKGAGMIDPNMATMLCFLTTDAVLEKEVLQHCISVAVEQSFNRITIDGDMSTNDTVLILANGLAGNVPLQCGTPDFEKFQAALDFVTRTLAKLIVEDGEGVTKFVEVHVNGAASFSDARRAAEAVAKSTLTKCAWFGGDPNWGRIMDAIGYSGVRMREELTDIYYDGVLAVKGGVVSATPMSTLQAIVAQKRFAVKIDLHLGSAEYVVYTTDLSMEYVRLNMGE
ncbi:MAG: bifunctional glutamate N-acetyltransferase/amino-acid acetyltransferase ArgJ [Verrucomicrobiota bacterium]|jgi:glutamate N-acetyltransferase/amino-acid N-acetyltransferase